MKIEFKKVPQTKKEFELNLDSVKFSGTFCRISSKLAKLDGKIQGNLPVQCAKCGDEFNISLDEKQLFVLSDGPFSVENEKEGELIIEVEDHIVDFDAILDSELESIRSDFHVCSQCINNDTLVDIEF